MKKIKVAHYRIWRFDEPRALPWAGMKQAFGLISERGTVAVLIIHQPRDL